MTPSIKPWDGRENKPYSGLFFATPQSPNRRTKKLREEAHHIFESDEICTHPIETRKKTGATKQRLTLVMIPLACQIERRSLTVLNSTFFAWHAPRFVALICWGGAKRGQENQRHWCPAPGFSVPRCKRPNLAKAEKRQNERHSQRQFRPSRGIHYQHIRSSKLRNSALRYFPKNLSPDCI